MKRLNSDCTKGQKFRGIDYAAETIASDWNEMFDFRGLSIFNYGEFGNI